MRAFVTMWTTTISGWWASVCSPVLFSAAFQLSQTRRGTVLGYPSAAETAGSAIGGNISQLGADVTRRNLNIQPTIKVSVGYRFNVRVNRDMLFELPYRPVAG
jgi:type IV secretory pathway VirB10-like protein